VGKDHRETFARMKMLLLCSLRGSITIWQGEELGLTQVDVPFDQLQDPEAIANWPQTLNRDGVRTPMPWRSDAPNLGFSTGEPWLPAGEDHQPRAVDRQSGDPDSVLAFSRHCLNFRSQSPALRLGSMTIIEAGEQLLRFERSCDGQRLLCTFNLSESAAAFEPSGSNLLSSGDFPAHSIAPYSAIIEDLR
jgi:alpha-glucosidase